MPGRERPCIAAGERRIRIDRQSHRQPGAVCGTREITIAHGARRLSAAADCAEQAHPDEVKERSMPARRASCSLVHRRYCGAAVCSRNTRARRRRDRARCRRPRGRRSGTPSRIVSVGGAVTEILYALGLEQPRHRGRLDQPVSAARARREAERRLHAAIVGRKACSGSAPRWCSPPTARAPRRRSRCWRPPRSPSCASPTASPARASSRRSR